MGEWSDAQTQSSLNSVPKVFTLIPSLTRIWSIAPSYFLVGTGVKNEYKGIVSAIVLLGGLQEEAKKEVQEEPKEEIQIEQIKPRYQDNMSKEQLEKELERLNQLCEKRLKKFYSTYKSPEAQAGSHARKFYKTIEEIKSKIADVEERLNDVRE